MAKLSFRDRWIRVIPAWLGNAEAENPFSVEVRRLDVEDLDAFRAQLLELRQARTTTVDDLCRIFDGRVRLAPGPVLEIDGGKVEDLEGLLEYGAQESLLFDGSLVSVLGSLVIGVNALSEEAEGNSERRHGGDGSTVAAAHPSDAVPAEPISSTASISSAPSPTAPSGSASRPAPRPSATP